MIIAAGNHVRGLLDALGPLRNDAMAIDLFGDRDTCSGNCGHHRVSDVAEIARYVEQLSGPERPVAILWAGGTENSPMLLREAEKNAGIVSLGTDSRSIGRIRNPFLLGKVLIDNGFDVLPLRHSPPATQGEDWLVKPFCSGGGYGIFRYTAEMTPPAQQDFYFQEFAQGAIFGASFTAMDGRTELHGICQHRESTNPDLPFRYEGSIGPLDIDRRVRDWSRKIGDLLAAVFNLQGWFGIDFVFRAESGDCRLLEVNPRFTFSMELIDRRWPGRLLRRHLEAFYDSDEVARGLLSALPKEDAAGVAEVTQPGVFFASRVLFNDSCDPFRMEDDFAEWLWSQNRSEGRAVCDVPWPGTIHNPGEPVCTLFSSGKTASEAGTLVDEQAANVIGRIRSNSGSPDRVIQSGGPERGQTRHKGAGKI